MCGCKATGGSNPPLSALRQAQGKPDKMLKMNSVKMRMEEKLLDKFHLVEARHWWWEGRRELIRQLLEKERINRVLDIGCGTGETLNFIKTLLPKAEVCGVDTSRVAVGYSKGRGHQKVFLADGEKLPFKKNLFDAVLILDVLEHIEADKKAILEAKRVIKKGGVIIVSCPAFNALWSDHDTNQGHIKRYVINDFQKLAKALNLKIEWVGYFNFFLSPVIAAVRWMSRIPGLKKMASYESGANYEVANYGLINKVLKMIFVTEVKLTQKINYPWGVSVAVKLRK